MSFTAPAHASQPKRRTVAVEQADLRPLRHEPAGHAERMAALHHGMLKGKGRLVARRGGGLQCVAFARNETGIALSGNAADWWWNAAGVYARGNRPEVGSVLNFRANGRMRLGHVAVVTEVVNSREINIDHANWGGPGLWHGAVARDMRVVDVSAANDWSAVRVELGHTDDFGAVYPTYGFIYDRPAGTLPAVVQASAGSAAVPAMNPVPRDLRPAAERVPAATGFDEVAEAPASVAPTIDLSMPGLGVDAPNRGLR